jgi:hypothetical protein
MRAVVYSETGGRRRQGALNAVANFEFEWSIRRLPRRSRP